MAFLPYLCATTAGAPSEEGWRAGGRNFRILSILYTRNHILQDMVTQDQMKDLSGRELALRRYL